MAELTCQHPVTCRWFGVNGSTVADWREVVLPTPSQTSVSLGGSCWVWTVKSKRKAAAGTVTICPLTRARPLGRVPSYRNSSGSNRLQLGIATECNAGIRRRYINDYGYVCSRLYGTGEQTNQSIGLFNLRNKCTNDLLPVGAVPNYTGCDHRPNGCLSVTGHNRYLFCSSCIRRIELYLDGTGRYNDCTGRPRHIG